MSAFTPIFIVIAWPAAVATLRWLFIRYCTGNAPLWVSRLRRYHTQVKACMTHGHLVTVVDHADERSAYVVATRNKKGALETKAFGHPLVLLHGGKTNIAHIGWWSSKPLACSFS
jgi:hypothetical protein